MIYYVKMSTTAHRLDGPFVKYCCKNDAIQKHKMPVHTLLHLINHFDLSFLGTLDE